MTTNTDSKCLFGFHFVAVFLYVYGLFGWQKKVKGKKVEGKIVEGKKVNRKWDDFTVVWYEW
jgi:hypothetical protein